MGPSTPDEGSHDHLQLLSDAVSDTSTPPSSLIEATSLNSTLATQETTSNIQSAFSSPLRITTRHDFSLDAATISQKLIHAVQPCHTETITDFMHKCVDLFMLYQFPNTPIAHEPTLRSAIALFDRTSVMLLASPPYADSTSVEPLRRFTLVTAICALVISVMPRELLDSPKDLFWPYYYASRAMLRLYEEYDLEFPDWSSFCIRTWHSAGLENTTGRDVISSHIHREGTFLALKARIYDEKVIGSLLPVDARLLRMNWWLSYLADKTAAAFDKVPYVISDGFCDDRITIDEEKEHENLLLDPSRPWNQNRFEHRLLLGFQFKRRLWAAAADVVHGIRLHSKNHRSDFADSRPDQQSTEKLYGLYLHFCGIIDDLPQCLQLPDAAAGPVEPEVVQYQALSFWAQRSNILSVYHCMRIVILQLCLDADLAEVVGLNNMPISWAMRKLEICQDFLRELSLIPFNCYRVQGEPAVERVRRVGSILLAVVNDPPTPPIEKRARTQLEKLLDILSSLDSRATDHLQDLENNANICS
ncbi:hypothetical protein BU24DRAFT_463119 [Aaosphaeria arxii CBS 175.79]|uniref:Transcription factor domain-containing protein n=1 Tax=Aaosphaeria arxii CBS 175.79 TaxID=1450172 RepID=A0A6A5XNH2_9PLEO|nr:uncharacterized protein BU24DRAFT_463119 [Aaosphaeria arxii CBS 175.79]KAF2014321.1 hypothetical protein BU24DRAFT_463119 [Aaosphaeria arxii CBS 175.79]